MEHAPYEILSSHMMPFSDIIRLKRLEDVLEKYWNSHRMDHTAKYLIRHVFDSPFDFFQEFGDYWEERGWQKIGHQLEDLFTRLQSFLIDRGTPSMDVITGLMKLDYFLGHKYKPRKIWWDFVLDKSDWSSYLKDIAANPGQISAQLAEAGLNERELQKYTVLEVLPFSLEAVLDSISGMRADEGLEDGEADMANLEALPSADSPLQEAADSSLEETAQPSSSAVAVAEPASIREGRTLLIVMYQQNESQRAQYYTLPL